MKTLVFIFCLLPAFVSAQSQSDYVLVFEKFVEHYNSRNTDYLCTLTASMDPYGKCMWKSLFPYEEPVETTGKILSYKYLGLDKADTSHGHAFQVVFEHMGEQTIKIQLRDASSWSLYTRLPYSINKLSFPVPRRQ